MDRTYTKEITVIEPECDVNQRITLAGIMRHAQQMGSDHLAQAGLDYNQLARDGMVFVVTKMQITITCRPVFGEQLVLTTIPKQPKGVQFIRDTFFETVSGEKLIEVSIAWALVDAATHKILRPSAFDRYEFEMNPNDGEYISGYKIKKPGEPGVMHLRQVKYSDLDYNRHVNNAIYANIVCDFIPLSVMLERDITSFGILYQKEAAVAQVLELEVIPDTNDTAFYVGGLVNGARCFEAEIKFKKMLDKP